MTTSAEQLSKYVQWAKLWTYKNVADINEYGFTIGANNKKYTSIEDFVVDCEKQIKQQIENNEITADISVDSALKILVPFLEKKETDNA